MVPEQRPIIIECALINSQSVKSNSSYIAVGFSILNKSKKAKTDQSQDGAYAMPLANMPTGNLIRHFSDDDVLFAGRQIGLDIRPYRLGSIDITPPYI